MAFRVFDTEILERVVDLDLKKYMWRTYSGMSNNTDHPDWGTGSRALVRASPSAYGDGISSLAVRVAPGVPNPRSVSNAICKTTGIVPNSQGLSNMVWMFGQFVDHELDLTDSNPNEHADIETPDEPAENHPNHTILFERSLAMADTSPREHPNMMSSFMDGANIYGVDDTRNMVLRRMDGSGKFKTTNGLNGEALLPYNVYGLDNRAPMGADPTIFFVSGDVRINENVFLIAMHTLFVREHNYICDRVAEVYPNYNEELIYQQARRIVCGEMQQIIYGEFLPALLGSNSVPEYSGYDATVSPDIRIEFSTTAFRIGHPMIPSELAVSRTEFEQLRNLFFNPNYVTANGVDDIISGSFSHVMKEIDGTLVEDLRSFLFGPPTANNLLDLASLNIQRGRDHGLPGFNAVRVAYGLPALNNFSDLTNDIVVQLDLMNLYGSMDNVDPWVGMVVEKHVPSAAVGETIKAILLDQFLRLRDGDRFYYENDLSLTNAEKNEIRLTKLSDIIRRNTSLIGVPNDVFHV